MAADAEETPPHAFPAWPLNCLTFYLHLADDYGRCVSALGKVTDPAQAARAEGDYGVLLLNDMIQAWWDLALAPMTALIKTTTETSPSTAHRTVASKIA